MKLIVEMQSPIYSENIIKKRANVISSPRSAPFIFPFSKTKVSAKHRINAPIFALGLQYPHQRQRNTIRRTRRHRRPMRNANLPAIRSRGSTMAAPSVGTWPYRHLSVAIISETNLIRLGDGKLWDEMSQAQKGAGEGSGGYFCISASACINRDLLVREGVTHITTSCSNPVISK